MNFKLSSTYIFKTLVGGTRSLGCQLHLCELRQVCVLSLWGCPDLEHGQGTDWAVLEEVVDANSQGLQMPTCPPSHPSSLWASAWGRTKGRPNPTAQQQPVSQAVMPEEKASYRGTCPHSQQTYLWFKNRPSNQRQIANEKKNALNTYHRGRKPLIYFSLQRVHMNLKKKKNSSGKNT